MFFYLLYVGMLDGKSAHVHKYACTSIQMQLLISPHLGCVNQAGYLNRIICWNEV